MPVSINNRLIFLVLTFAASILFVGCSSDQDPTFVDFSKKMVVDQSPDELLDGSVIRVAVAAMISAKESAVYYHQLLDFIADQLGHKIQIIQRKTYSEIMDPKGKKILDELMIDRFLHPEDKWYESIVAMKHECNL
ncbi:MAG: hypothetical protein WBM69_19460 [Desulfobacterales bacterium]